MKITIKHWAYLEGAKGKRNGWPAYMNPYLTGKAVDAKAAMEWNKGWMSV